MSTPCIRCRRTGRNPNDNTVICFHCHGTGDVPENDNLVKRVEALERAIREMARHDCHIDSAVHGIIDPVGEAGHN